ncbi:FxSxx-COOH system tetratricopeptide repeat protein [Umezawaea sp. NPDC059074]|uniref:FxSxx-COOH system tetratricopeptide repeat protein n=1 Tax=Umezawaea sp. NPDC059074 TaxID=3346716 RepID=UPI0036B7F8FA
MADEWDFFVSYTATDRSWAEWVAWQLEEAGHRVLIQAWDMVPGSNWVNSMHEGVQKAARTIALLSPAYLNSVYGTIEWQAAWRDDPLGEERKLLVFRVAECERPGLLGPVVSQDLFGLLEGATRRRLHDAVNAAVTGRAKPTVPPGFPGAGRAIATEPRFPGGFPEVWNIPPRNPNFTGRAESLTRLREVMRSSAAVAVHSLRGMGGVGKSQLAIEYTYRFADDFDVVWWIPAEQPSLIPNHLANLGEKLGVPARTDLVSMVSAAYDVLRGRTRWLLIFDNAEDPVTLREYLPPSTGQVVITTRRAGFSALGAELNVDVLDPAESIALLKRRLPTITDDQAVELADELDGLPLAIEQASAYMITTGLAAPAYLELMQTHATEMIGRGRVAGREDTLVTLWDLSLSTLTQQQPAAVTLLDLLAYLAPEPVPLNLFTDHSNELSTPLAEAVASPVAFADVVGALVDHFLVRRTADDLTIVHRLLQQSIRSRHTATWPPEGAAHLRIIAQNLLVADLPNTIMSAPENWPRWRALLPHVLASCEEFQAHSVKATDNESWLLDRAATYLRVHGQPVDARILFERALAIDEATYGPVHPIVATALSNLGGAVRDLGQPADAKPLYERALAIDEVTYGPDHPDVATALNNLGGAVRDLGQPADAKPLFERALAITEATYGPVHPTVAIRLNNLGGALRDLGQPADAKPLYERALAIAETTYGPDHPDVAASLSNLGGALRSLGQPADAKPLYERALTIAETTYGPDHPTVAASLSNLGVALSDLSQPANAKLLFERALAIDEATYGPDHPTVAIRLSNLGVALSNLGQPADAKPLYERALAINKTTYGPDHPDVASR